MRQRPFRVWCLPSGDAVSTGESLRSLELMAVWLILLLNFRKVKIEDRKYLVRKANTTRQFL
jgi:hypothetical protein